MAIKVIVELQAKPGRRAELSSLVVRIIANEGPSQHGFRGSTRYEVLEYPDVLVEIAGWESAELDRQVGLTRLLPGDRNPR